MPLPSSPSLSRHDIVAALSRWMAGACLTASERVIVDAVLRFNAADQFARCHEVRSNA